MLAVVGKAGRCLGVPAERGVVAGHGVTLSTLRIESI